MEIADCDAFRTNKLLCHAVVYNLQCIGENAYKLSREFVTAHKEVDWNGMEGLRHILVHDYYNVNLATVWTIAKCDLQPLEERLLEILER